MRGVGVVDAELLGSSPLSTSDVAAAGVACNFLSCNEAAAGSLGAGAGRAAPRQARNEKKNSSMALEARIELRLLASAEGKQEGAIAGR